VRVTSTLFSAETSAHAKPEVHQLNQLAFVTIVVTVISDVIIQANNAWRLLAVTAYLVAHHDYGNHPSMA
jgi:hypothetical protein